jgi:putative inorganic carbon (HCO3(-)) transporter
LTGQQPRFALWSYWIEGGILTAVTPFLLFPSFNPVLTTSALFIIALLWVLPLVLRPWPWPPLTPFDPLILGWGICLLVGILVTADPHLTLPKATGLILGLAVWRFMNRTIQSSQALLWALVAWGIIAFGFITSGILSANWLDKIPGLATITTRLPGSLLLLPEAPALGVHSNQLAGTLLFVIPFMLSVLIGFSLSRPSPLKLITWLLLTLTAVTLLLFTQSRTGWVALGGVLLLLPLLWWLALPPLHPSRRFMSIAALSIAAVGILALFIIGPGRLQKVWADPNQESAVGSLGSVGFRQEVWQWAITAVQDFPFTGTGLGSFRAVVRRLYPLNVNPHYDIAHAHNIFLQTALDVGLPGLIFYLSVIGLACYLGLWAARQDEGARPYLIGLLASVLAVHLFGLTDALAPGSKPHLLLWIMLGLITASHRLIYGNWQKNRAVLSLAPGDTPQQ